MGGQGGVLAGGIVELPRPHRPLTEQRIRVEDLIVVQGLDAHVGPANGPPVEIWTPTNLRCAGIDGMPRMGMIRDDIAARAEELAVRLTRR